MVYLQGEGIEGAEIYINGVKSAVTDSRGSYTVEGVKAGSTYQISVKYPSIYFDDVTVKVVPSEPQLPTIFPSR